jgi:hypothetical protein
MVRQNDFENIAATKKNWKKKTILKYFRASLSWQEVWDKSLQVNNLLKHFSTLQNVWVQKLFLVKVVAVKLNVLGQKWIQIF